MAFVHLASQAWVSILFGQAEVVGFSNASGEFGGPGGVFLEEKRLLFRLFLRFSSPDCPVSPVERLTTLPLRTSSPIFGVCGLLVCCHADWLDRFAFGCGNNISLAYAREVGSKPHSQGLAHAFPWVLSCLASDLFTIFHTAVPPSACASEAIVPSVASSLVACSSYRPPMRAI